MSFGERIVELLKAENVEVIFSQGDLSMKDIQKHAELQGLNVVGPRHEACGVFMAMGYYAMTGRPQAAFGAMGPGQSNLIPAAITAAREEIPVILFGSRRQKAVRDSVRRGRWLFYDHMPLFREVCKYAASIEHPAHLDDVVHEAFRQALSGTPGPVYIEYDFTMQVEEWDFSPALKPAQYRALPRGAAEGDVTAFVEAIQSANLPVLVGGEGVHRTRSHDLFRDLAEWLKCPVVNSFGGSATLPETHDQWLLSMSAAGQEALSRADLLIAVGTPLPEMANYGRVGHFTSGNPDRKVAVIDPDPSAVGMNLPVDHAVIGHVPLVLEKVLARLEKMPARQPVPELAGWRASWLAERADVIASIPQTNKVHPSRMMYEARKGTPDDAVVVVDGGNTILYQMACFEKRCHDFLYTANFSHLGSGLGLAIGTQLGMGRDRPVCLLSGDGALGFHFMEFETAVRHNLPIVVILNDDQLFGAEMAQHMEHIGHDIQVSLGPVDYAAMAEAIGGYGAFVTRAEDIEGAVKEAFKSGKPALVQVKTDPAASHAFPQPYVDHLVSWLIADPMATFQQDV